MNRELRVDIVTAGKPAKQIIMLPGDNLTLTGDDGKGDSIGLQYVTPGQIMIGVPLAHVLKKNK